MTAKKRTELIDRALEELRRAGVTYPKILAFIAGCGRKFGSFPVGVKLGPGRFVIYDNGIPKKTKKPENAIRLFAIAIGAAVQLPRLPHKTKPFTLDPKIYGEERARVQKELAERRGVITEMVGEITEESEFKITAPSATEPIRSEELASMEELEEERRRKEEAGIQTIGDGQST